MPTNDQVKAAVERYSAAVSAADKHGILACFSEGATVVDPYPSPAHVGREAISQFWDGVFALGTPLAFLPEKLVACGDRAVFIFAITVEGGNGERFGFEGFDVVTVNDEGLINELTAYWDLAELHPVPAT